MNNVTRKNKIVFFVFALIVMVIIFPEIRSLANTETCIAPKSFEITPTSVTLDETTTSQQLKVTYDGADVTSDPATTYTPDDPGQLITDKGLIKKDPNASVSIKNIAINLEIAHKDQKKTVTVTLKPKPDCELIYGNANAPYVIFFSRTNSMSEGSPCGGTINAWDPNNATQLEDYKKDVKTAVTQDINTIGSATQKFAVYSSDNIFPSSKGPICPTIESNRSDIIFKNYNWVANNTGSGAYSIINLKSAYYCMGNKSLARKNMIAHELFGHAFAQLRDEYTNNDEGAYCMQQMRHGSVFYNITAKNDCSKWQSAVKTGCFKGAISVNFYRSTENSIMNDLWNASGFSPLQMYFINMAANDYSNLANNLRPFAESLTCP